MYLMINSLSTLKTLKVIVSSFVLAYVQAITNRIKKIEWLFVIQTFICFTPQQECWKIWGHKDDS